MDNSEQVLIKMGELLAAWEPVKDRRLIFLGCYKMMSTNVLAAIQADDFEDTAWVATLMENFAGYYFKALEFYENEPSSSPDVWRIAFLAAQNPRTHVLQNLVLGVNAHINFDLVFALSDLLASEWAQLSPEQRQMRYRDHCHINDIINQTIDQVQDEIIDLYEPWFGVVDKLLGPLDEWMTTLLISEWRDEVWKHAMRLIDPDEPSARSAVIQQVREHSLARAQDILGHASISELADFL